MGYIYTKTNLLEKPHNYMYTKYEGKSFLKAYQTDRQLFLQRVIDATQSSKAPARWFVEPAYTLLQQSFDSISAETGNMFRSVVMTDGEFETVNQREALTPHKLLSSLTDKESILTSELLNLLLLAQLNNQYGVYVKEWIDRLVQRFEVTKKIYDSYPSGFRKGVGLDETIHLLCLLALNLSLYYAKYQQIKYLSTLLKICDLLCSVPYQLLENEVTDRAMALVLATELVSIKLIISKKGINNCA